MIDNSEVTHMHAEMKPAIWTTYFRDLSPEDSVLAFLEAGFTYGEFSQEDAQALLNRGGDPEKLGNEFKRFLDHNGFSMPQGHLNFQNDLTTRETVEQLKREIALYQAIGVENAVLHLNGGKELPLEQRREKWFEALHELQQQVRGTNFTLCIENLISNPETRNCDQILGIIAKADEGNLGICLDTGHLNAVTKDMGTETQTQEEFILHAGKYLRALHINGNNGAADLHLAPYTVRNSVDFKEVLTALYRIGYHGLFNLEIPGEVTNKPPMQVRKLKLAYLRQLLDMMLAPDFCTTE